MTKERLDEIKKASRVGQTGNRERLIIELLIAIFEEIEKFNKKNK